MIEVSIIVPVFNAAASLGACIEALMQQDVSPETYEVIVVDDNSTDGSVAVAQRYPSVRVLSERRQSSYAARNRGIRIARGRWIAFTDADCVPKRDWLRRMKERMEAPLTMVVMGRDRPTGPTTAVRLLGEYDHFKESFVMSSADPSVYYGHTNNLIARREVFDGVGFFDERPRGADVIFVQRVLENYGTEAVQYQPRAVVDHTEIRSAFVYFQKAFIYGRSARGYSQLVPARPLRNAERFRIFRDTVHSCDLSAVNAGTLLGLLMLGVLAYGVGWLSLLRVPQAGTRLSSDSREPRS